MAVLAAAGIGAVIGGTIGYAYGYVALGVSIGWAVGSYVGSVMFGPDLQGGLGPRLEDLTVQTSAYGASIPDIFGAMRVSGNLIWSSGLIESTEEVEAGSGGKGGGGSVSSTRYTYSASFAIGLCEGEIGGIGRIWFDNKLWVDYRIADTQQNIAENKVTIYLGTESQTADSEIQSYETAADTPAYRGLAYLVFNDVPLASYGNHHPNVTVEVFKDASVADGFEEGRYVVMPEYGTIVAISGDPTINDTWEKFDLNYQFYRYDLTWSPELNLFCSVGLDFLTSPDGINWTMRTRPEYAIYYGVCWSPELELFCAVCNPTGEDSFGYTVATSSDGITWTSRVCPGRDWRDVCWSSDLTLFCAIASSGTGNRVMTSPDGITWTTRTSAADNEWWHICWSSDLTLFCAVARSGTGNRIMTSPDGITWTVRTNPEDNTWQEIIWVDDLNLFVAVSSDGTNRAMTSSNGTTWTARALSASYSWYGVCWSSTQERLIAIGNTGGSDTYVYYSADGITWNSTFSISDFVGNNIIWTSDINITRYTYNSTHFPTRGNIISKLCTDANLSAGEIDVTALTATLYGYVRSNVMSAQSAIEQLLFAYLIDVAEIDGKLVFTPRGNASIETIPIEDLAAIDGEGITDNIVETKANETELPSQLKVKFLHQGRDYEIGTQYYAYHFTTTLNEQIIDLPIAMTEGEGLRIATNLLTAVWTARTRYTFTTTTKYMHLTPTDIVTVNGIKMRVATIGIKGGLLAFECASEYDDDLFDSTIETDENDFDDETPSYPGETITLFLDCPAFDENGDNSGFYFGAYGASSGWNGCILYYSSDGGSSFTRLETLNTIATVGITDNVLVDQTAKGLIWDRENTVDIQMVSANQTLSSTSENAVLNGANIALLGIADRWEIIQFADVTYNGSGNYTLSNLLRGRFGTEWAMDQHAVSDQFILINSALIRVNLGSDNIGLQRTYRADSIGSLTQADTENFTLQAISLKCYTVEHITGERDGSNNLTISWIRRDRIDGEWRDNVGIGLSEAAEYYGISIMDGVSVVRSISATTNSASYTAAEQTTDFGSPQSSIDIRIYQWSAIVGWGTVKEATV